MTVGEKVRVYPQGELSKAAIGTIVLISTNGNSIAVSFGEAHVPFITGSTGLAIHPEHGKMMLMRREEDGWHDMFYDGRYEVETVQPPATDPPEWSDPGWA